MRITVLHLQIMLFVIIVGHGRLNLVLPPLIQTRQQIIEYSLSVAALVAILIGRDGLSANIATHFRALVVIVHLLLFVFLGFVFLVTLCDV